MNAKPRRSIRRRLTIIIMATSITVVLLACVGFVMQDFFDLRKDLEGDLANFGEIMSTHSNAALTFGDHKGAEEILATLRQRPSVIAGCIYTAGNAKFATYGNVQILPADPQKVRDGISRSNNRVELRRGITLDGERVGTLYIVSDLRDIHDRMDEDAWFVVVTLGVCMFVALVLSWRLQGRISGPIVALAGVADLVSREKNFSVRVDHRALNDSDEIGNLMTGFNGMLAEIEERDAVLRSNQSHLEETVALRTSELTESNKELIAAKGAALMLAATSAELARESALILNSASDGIIGLDNSMTCTFLNPSGARVLGRTLEELKAKSIHELVHHSHADGTPWAAADCPMGQAMSRGEAYPLSDDTFWRSDGSSFPVECAATPMFDESGIMHGAVIMFRDVTERRAIERMKSEFVSTVSHELRTPLTSIRGALGLLSSGMLGTIGDKGQRMLEIAVSNTDRLVRLINDILDLERIESRKVELAKGSVDANEVIVHSVEGLQSMADQAGVKLVVKAVRGSLWGDSDRIIQTLTNLLGNAIKFSPRDTTVTVSGEANETQFTFCVADEGRGVPADKLEAIFGRFSQVDASDSRDKGGSGLGLAICQSIVTAHGGRIWAEKNEPAGSRFLFTIPLEVRPVSLAAPRHDRRTILVCEDATPPIAETLERAGFQVVMASTFAEVAAVASSVHPDAIVLHIVDGGNGRHIVDALKSTVDTQLIPIVVATGHFPESYERYAAAVANWVIDPLKEGDLVRAIDMACAGPTILVVEDDLDLAGVMTTAMQSHGIRTLHAVSGGDAVRLCRQHEPSLIVLDLMLPDMDGFAVVAALRESASLRAVPLLVYSALDIGSIDQSRLRLGPTEFLTKSRCSLAEFDMHVVRLLDTVTNRTTEVVPDAA